MEIKEVRAEEVKESEEEFVAVQYVVSVELKVPFQEGNRKISWVDITTSGKNGVAMNKEELRIETNVDGEIEYIPRENIVKRREKVLMIPQLEGHEFGSYVYTPYTYPQKMGGWLGSYHSNEGIHLAFLDIYMQVVLPTDLEA